MKMSFQKVKVLMGFRLEKKINLPAYRYTCAAPPSPETLAKKKHVEKGTANEIDKGLAVG